MARQAASSGSDGSSSEEFAFRKGQADHEQRTRDAAVHDGKIAMWVAVGASVMGLLCSAYGIFSFRSDDSFFCPAFVITAVGWGILIGIELFLLRELHAKRRGHHGAIIRRSAFIFGGWCFGYFAAALVVVVICMVKGRFANSSQPGIGYTLLITEATLDLLVCSACLARYVHRYLQPMRHAQPHLEDKANMESTEKQIARKVSGASHRVVRKVSSASSRFSGKGRGSKRSTRPSQPSDRPSARTRPSPTKKKDDYGSASASESSASHGSASSQPSSEDELLPPQHKTAVMASSHLSTPSAKRQSSQPASTSYPPTNQPPRSSGRNQVSELPAPYRSPTVPLARNTPSSAPHSVLVEHQTPRGTEVRRWDVDTQRYKPVDARAKYLESVSHLPKSLQPGYSSGPAPSSRSPPAVQANSAPAFPPMPPPPPHPYGPAPKRYSYAPSRSGTAPPASSTKTRAPYTSP
ncbi:hypothetical protein NBRC10513v2_000791 [Rhodotorula toruloides]|uniref:Proteophosphoglycan ppg4 n=1 Tax=Rhodotorula toruloides TaxID=5286 RepID=A0A2T0A4F0_RHOTO|nr:Proteophosphoglycan ppg4 [Rhodotorula toruloides]